MGAFAPVRIEVSLVNLEEVLADIERADSLLQMRRILDSVASGCGFAAYNFIDAGSVVQDTPFWIGTTEKVWEQEYIANKFASHDPVIRKALTENLPFFWSDIHLPVRMGPRERARQTMDAARDHGFRNGFVIPHHYRDELGRTYSTCTCFFWKSALKGFFLSIGIAKHDLHLIMMYWSAKASELGRKRKDTKGRPGTHGNLGGPTIKIALTDRERDVLFWSAHGKTTDDIAAILMISSATVNSYFRQAIIKLDANGRTHAVAKAIYLEILVP